MKNHSLTHLSDESFAILRESDDGRSDPTTFGVRNDDGIAAFHDGHD